MRALRRLPLGLLALVWLVVAALPFYFMALTGFKGQFELFNGVFALPESPSLSNYTDILTQGGFFTYLGNSLLIVAVSVAVILLLSAMAAFVFARLTFRLNSALFGFVLAGLVIPLHVTLIPVYLLTRQLGLYDSLWALLGPYVAFNLPVSIFIMSEFMREIPFELEEAAHLDGCSTMGRFFRIILPLSTPGLATLAIYNSVILWNEFVFAFVLITSPQNRPLPLAIWEYQGQYAMNIPAIMAVLTLSTLPLILVYVFGQERIVSGMMAGVLKG
jgi:raffinose/stachyose/melibiose transport system permease protein